MSRSFDETVPIIQTWFDCGQAGMLLMHKAPERNGDPHAEQWIELYLRREDMDKNAVAAADYLLKKTSGFKLEVSSADGEMTKIKVKRRL